MSDWQPTYANNGVSHFIDRDSIIPDCPLIIFWEKEEYNPPSNKFLGVPANGKTVGLLKTQSSEWQINCETQEWRIVNIVAEDINGLTAGFPEPNNPWETIQKGTLPELYAKQLCPLCNNKKH